MFAPVRGWPHVVVLQPWAAGLALCRRMVRLGARVTVIDTPSEPFVACSRGVRGVVAPYDPHGEPWLAAIEEVAADGDEIALLPTFDSGSELLARCADRLPANVRAFERLSPGAHLALIDKDQSARIAERAGVRVPWTARVSELDELADLAPRAPWPCVVKPIVSHEWRARYGVERVFVVRDVDEAERLLTRPLTDGVGMLLSQYVPGADSDVEEAILVRLADGSYPVAFGCRKLRQYPRGFGVTALGESSTLPETFELARRVLDEAGFVGVAGVETKRHAETDERWFIEVNVRIPGQWGLGDACGVDATRRCVAALMDEPLDEQPPLRPGVRIGVPELDARLALAALRETPARRVPLRAWRLARSYAGVRELGFFDPRDPRPGLALTRLFASRRLARLKR